MRTRKFPELQLGERFRYGGETFVKTTPLVAVCESDGKQRMIPRSANVETVQENDAKKPPLSAEPSSRDDAIAAVEDYHERCVQLLSQAQHCAAGLPVANIREQLELARDRLLGRLGVK